MSTISTITDLFMMFGGLGGAAYIYATKIYVPPDPNAPKPPKPINLFSRQEFWQSIRDELPDFPLWDAFKQTYIPLYDEFFDFPTEQKYVNAKTWKKCEYLEHDWHKVKGTEEHIDRHYEEMRALQSSLRDSARERYQWEKAAHEKKVTRQNLEIVRQAILQCGKNIQKELGGTQPLFVLPLHDIIGSTDKLTRAMIDPIVEAENKHPNLFESFPKCPFNTLAYAPAPYEIPFDILYNHMHVLAGSGGGKTTWLKALFMHLLNRRERPSIVVMDSQGTLIKQIMHLDVFHPEHGALKDKLIYISAREVQFPPALNMFDIPFHRINKDDPAEREMILSGIIDTFKYLFDHLLGMELSRKQGGLFANVLTLLVTLPETMGRPATLQDMIDLMRHPERYLPAINKLKNENDKKFWLEAFMAPPKENTYIGTRGEIANRLESLRTKHPAIERLFMSKENRIDFFEAMNEGYIILIDTTRDVLKANVSIYGRILLSMIVNAAFERVPIDEEKRHPVMFLIDEAWQYFDAKSAEMLVELRKFHVGFVLAHQNLKQTDDAPGLESALDNNTAIKLIAQLGQREREAMRHILDLPRKKPDEPDFFSTIPEHHMATYIRGKTKTGPVFTRVPFRVLENAPQMDEADYQKLLTRNRRRTAGSPQPEYTQEFRAQPEREFGEKSAFDDGNVVDAEYTEVKRGKPPTIFLPPPANDDPPSTRPGKW